MTTGNFLNEKKPLLKERSQGNGELEIANHAEHRESTYMFHAKPWRHFRRPFYHSVLLLSLLAFWWALSRYTRYTPPKTSNVTALLADLEYDIQMMAIDRMAQHKGCSSVVASRDRQFDFNFTGDGSAANRWQLLDSSVPESRKNFQGQVTVDKGDRSQVSDMEVHVIISSSDEKDLDNVHLHKSDSVLNIDYEFRDNSEVCTQVQILVLLRPEPKRSLDWFDIQTSIFDITFKSELGWEINNLRTHTSHGDLWMDGQNALDPLIAHNVSHSSIDGVIFGWFVPDETLALHNEEGGIGVFLHPMLAEDVPWDPKNISVSTVSGRIQVGLYYNLWPARVYTHRTTIESVSGWISARVPHGVHTNISSITNNITTAIHPYWGTDPDSLNSTRWTNEIHTTSSGDSSVLLYNPPKKSLHEHYNPLFNTLSTHEAGEGELWVTYPFEWWGSMKGKTEHGKLEFDGSLLRDVKRGEGSVAAKRGAKGESWMEAHITTGALNIQLGLRD
ncbi:hypothetical protein BCR34DRAFT_546133 [Clohesyomyces aquaticus]|uniref:Uncharacterized protein n=1 Tax=Clohesyomyces aquaticus TaxID=1231657 RepID=A0A1Y1YUR5_9PLEO|nr:hypothetical protein BCR34DRAFT_546133 [Clohesyomyces aquaticus]